MIVQKFMQNWNKFCWTYAAVLLLISIYYGSNLQSRMLILDESLLALRESAEELGSSRLRIRREISEMQSDVVESQTIKLEKRSAVVDMKEDQYFGMMEGGGAIYVRWGRRDCSTENSLSVPVYVGYTAGTHYTHTGGGSNYLCIDGNITYHGGHFKDGNNGASNIYGAEVRDSTWIHPLFDLSDTERNYFRLNSLPCVLCLAQLMITQIMIPGRENCPKGWTLEYRGYIMGGSHGDKHTSSFICVDEKPQVVPGTNTDEGGASVHMAEPQCSSLLCEPFVAGRELQCVVCTY